MFEKWIEQHREEIISKTQGILRINSVGCPVCSEDQPFGQGPAEALDYFLNLGREMGFTVKNVDGYAGHVEYGEGDDYIAVLGHLDVVPVGTGWTYPPFGAEIHDGKIYARGAIDDKGPTMAGLFALQAVKESGVKLSKRVRVIVGLDEESNWQCMDHYFKKEPLPFGGFTPDADFPLIYAEKGLICYDIKQKRADLSAAPVVVRELKGGNRVNMVPDQCRVRLDVTGDVETVVAQIRTAANEHNVQADVEVRGSEITLFVQGLSVHAMAPHTGVNAIVQAGKVLAALDTADQAVWAFLAENDTEGKRVGIDMVCEVTGPLTNNLGLAQVTEDEVVFTYNARHPVDKRKRDFMELMTAKLAPEGWVVTDSPGNPDIEPLYVPKDSEIVKTLLRVYEEEVGEKAEPLTIGGGTYARAIPNAVAFGALFPGQEETAHQKDEYWAVEDLIRCTGIFAKAIYELAK
jgi:succinyl-diaminopimelate desuccinylase